VRNLLAMTYNECFIMLLAEYPWLLSQGMKASMRKNIVSSRDGACPVSTSHSEFAQTCLPAGRYCGL